MAGAFALVLARRELLAVAALTLGALVKVTAGLPLLLLVVWCVARAPAGRRVRTLVTHAGLAAAIAAVFAAPFFNLHDPTLGILELAGHEGWLAPSRFFRRLLDAVSGDTLGGVARVAFALVLLDGRWSSWCEPSGARRSARVTTAPPRRSWARRGDGRSCC